MSAEHKREVLEAWKKANPDKLRKYGRRWKERFPERAREMARDGTARWRAANPDKCRESQRREDVKPERKKRKREYMRRVRERDPEPSRIANRKWHRENHERVIALNRKYRARKYAAPGELTTAAIAARVAYYGDCCAYCSGPYECLDHVIPLSRGGTNWPANIRPACLACNSSKSNRMLAEWPGRRRADLAA